jgi:hypothetical protein
MGRTVYHPPDPWLYQASVVRIVTPAVYDLHVDVGFNMSREVRVQLRGVKEPSDYDPSVPDDGAVTAAANWVEAAAAPDSIDDFPFYIRTYKRPDPDTDTPEEPGEDLYEADVVRKCDADNLREYLTDTFPDMENGVSADDFDFFRNSGRIPDTDDGDQT